MSYSSGDYFGELVSWRTSRDLGYGLPNRVFFFSKRMYVVACILMAELIQSPKQAVAIMLLT